jgi:hypothetical protein
MDIKDVKYNLNKPVRYTNSQYLARDSVFILRGCIIRKDESTGRFYYQAEIQDPCGHSVSIVSLDKLTPTEVAQR